MQSLPVRILTAAAIVSSLFGVYKFFHAPGLTLFGLVIALFGAFEYKKLAFSHLKILPFIPIAFLVLGSLFLCLMVYLPINSSISGFALFLFAYITLCIWASRNKNENPQILESILMGSLGFGFAFLLPGFILNLLLHGPLGLEWFLFLVFVVAAGDIFAFFGGVWFGKEKLMPKVSPGKTIVGSLFSLCGSVLVGAGLSYYLFGLVMPPLLFVAALTNIFGQTGDLFVSLLKREAGVKDTGSLLPGHGGILDRLDAIYFAAPVIYSASLLLSIRA